MKKQAYKKIKNENDSWNVYLIDASSWKIENKAIFFAHRKSKML